MALLLGQVVVHSCTTGVAQTESQIHFPLLSGASLALKLDALAVDAVALVSGSGKALQVHKYRALPHL